MPLADLNRDDFVRRIERRRRWMSGLTKARHRLLGPAGQSVQAAVYDATFRSDEEAVAYHYASRNDHLPDLETPVWLNEKIRWQFLNHPNPLMTLAADKIAVRDYLRFKGARIRPPALLASGFDPGALEGTALPAGFALKSAYGSGQNHLERPGMATPRAQLIAKAREWLDWDQWRATGELHYRGVPRRWLAEELLPSAGRMREFKIFCILGEPVFVAVITERNRGGQAGLAGIRHALFDPDWKRLDFDMRGVETDPRPVPRPADLDLLLDEARLLSEDFLHVRVDFLDFDGRLCFSELTFASLAARVPFEPLSVNARLGARMDLDRADAYLERGRQIAARIEAG